MGMGRPLTSVGSVENLPFPPSPSVEQFGSLLVHKWGEVCGHEGRGRTSPSLQGAGGEGGLGAGGGEGLVQLGREGVSSYGKVRPNINSVDTVIIS